MTPAPYADPARSFLLTDAAALAGVMRSVSSHDWANPALATDRHVSATVAMLREELTQALAALEALQ